MTEKEKILIGVKFKTEHAELLETLISNSIDIKRLLEENNVLLKKCFDRNSMQVGERISKTQILDCGSTSSADKNIYNKIALAFYTAEKRFKDQGIDSSKFGLDDLRIAINAVIQKQFNLD